MLFRRPVLVCGLFPDMKEGLMDQIMAERCAGVFDARPCGVRNNTKGGGNKPSAQGPRSVEERR